MRELPESEALFSEAEAALKEANYQRAVEIYSDILTDWKDYAEVCERASASVGEVYITLRDLRLAEEYLKQAIGYNPLASHYHYLLGFAYSIGRQWDKARIEFEFVLKQQPENREYLRSPGWVLCNYGMASEGQEYLLQALALDPDNVSILIGLSIGHMDAREFDKALSYAQRVATVAPTNALVQLTCGMCCCPAKMSP